MKHCFILLILVISFPKCSSKKNNHVFTEGTKYGIRNMKGRVILEPTYSEIIRVDSAGLYVARKNGFLGLLSISGKELTAFKYSKIEDFQNGFAAFDIIDERGYNLFKGYLNKSGKEFIYPYLRYESLNWNVSNAPSEMPDSSHLLGFHRYLKFKWTLPSLLNHNLKAFVDEPQTYSDLGNLDKVCIGYGLLIACGNYSEDYMTKDPEKWNSFKKNTIYKIIETETLRKLTWDWIKPYYKDAYTKLTPFAKKTYQACFKYLKEHIDSFEKEKYEAFLKKDEKNFAKLNIDGKKDSKRKLSAFVDRLIIVHQVISEEDAKKWVNILYSDVRKWK